MMKRIYSLILALVLISCSSDNDAISDLEGSWLLEKVQMESAHTAPNDDEVVLHFRDGMLNGNAGSNIYRGGYSVQFGKRLIVSGMSSTYVATTPWEDIYLAAFMEAYKKADGQFEFSYTINGQNLILETGGEESTRMIFTRF